MPLKIFKNIAYSHILEKKKKEENKEVIAAFQRQV